MTLDDPLSYDRQEKTAMEHVYSIMPLAEDHFEERVADLIDQYQRRITTCPLFLMTLVPEGDPVINKIGRASCRERVSIKV